jgi:hypothetical protein
LLQPFQALNALDGRWRLRHRGFRRAQIGGVSHRTKLVRGLGTGRSFIHP